MAIKVIGVAIGLFLSLAASADSLIAKGKFNEFSLNTIATAFSRLKAVEQCGYYQGQWGLDGKWDDKKVSFYVSTGYSKFEDEASQANLVAVETEDLAETISTLAPPNEKAVRDDLAVLAEAASAALKKSKVLIFSGTVSSATTKANVIVFSNKKTKEFLTLGVRPTCGKF